MSDLGTYLTTAEITQTAFAEVVGATPSTISRICSGKRYPGRELLQKIVQATDGQVSAAELLGFPLPPISAPGVTSGSPSDQTDAATIGEGQ